MIVVFATDNAQTDTRYMRVYNINTTCLLSPYLGAQNCSLGKVSQIGLVSANALPLF